MPVRLEVRVLSHGTLGSCSRVLLKYVGYGVEMDA